MKIIKHKDMNRFYVLIGVLICWAAFYSCNRELSGARYDSNDEIQIMDYIDKREDLSTFRELIDYTGQRNLLKTAGAYTVFAPNNAAFEALFKSLSAEGTPVTSVQDRSKEFWLSYFRYHLLNQKINSNEFEFGPLPVPTVYQNKYLIADMSESYSSIRLNNTTTIVEGNIELTNGYIDIVDNVLKPPFNSVYETLKQSGQYNTMLGIFDETGYTRYLKDSIITLFVESDQALAKSNFSKEALPNLEEWVKYHIVADSGYFLNLMAGKRFYPLLERQALSFNVDPYGRYYINEVYPFSESKTWGIDQVCNNGIFHTLDTLLEIVDAVPATIRFNLYPPGSPYGQQNIFTVAPATISLNTGTKSYHQNKEGKIVAFNATQVGDYFYMTVPDVPAGKYRIRMIHRGGGTRGKYIVIYNNTVVDEMVNMAKADGAFEEWDYLSYNNCGEVTVSDRSDVTLYFAFAGFGSNSNPSYCCDLLCDMLELIPIK
ncbi:fasciclin domain-containing protein [Niabella aurantiaca]|uniref:fasciclin domain-containing protein n=1 Tax=Niabella aurantiaca TaxID=379900 RepID=UPI00036E82BB|nr:fasciclin domain-containing protein [Niabella aurantiaca]